MKFGHQERLSDGPPNYYPVPGHYKADQPNPRSISIYKNQRFKEEYPPHVPPPGEYFKSQNWIKKPPYRLPHEISQDKQEDSKYRIIPSIPEARGQTYYQELNEGLVAMQYVPVGEGLGPGCYENKEPFVQRRGQYQAFAKQHQTKRIQVIRQTLPENTRGRSVPGCNSKIKPVPHATKAREPIYLNLQYILQKEKFHRSKDVPPPGQYYNARVFSSFNPREKEKEFQCFDSSQARNLFVLEQGPGPGSYTLPQKSREKGVVIGKQVKKLSYLESRKNAPGPGSYLLLDSFFRQTVTQTRTPAAFGSADRRFHKAEAVRMPGPGSYNIGGKRAKKRKYMEILSQEKTVDTTKMHEQHLELSLAKPEPQRKQYVKHKGVNSTFTKAPRKTIETKEGVPVGHYNI